MGLYLFLTRPKVEESKPVQPKLKEEDDPNSPFFRGPRPDPPKPGKISQKSSAFDLHMRNSKNLEIGHKLATNWPQIVI